MLKTTTDNLNYCIIASGYTSRLVKKFGYEIKMKWENFNIIAKTDNFDDQELDEICDDVFMEDYDSETLIHDFLFIKDKLWGKGLYCLENDKSRVGEIIKILEEGGVNEDGIICFKSENLWKGIRLIELLKKVHFCNCFGVDGIHKMEIIESNGIKILVIYVDAESG